MTYREVKDYAEKRKSLIRSGDFNHVVEVSFFDAEMEIRWAFVEKKEDFVIVFAEHYPPIIHHEAETIRFRQTDFEGNEIKSWENGDREKADIGA